MRHLLHYLNKYKLQSILGPLFKLLEASFELMVPLVMASIIDTGIPNGDTAYVIKMTLVLVLLGLVGLASSLTAQYFSAYAAVGFCSDLRQDLFHHINTLTHAELDHIGTSTLITRITSDINQIQTGINLFLRLFLRSPFIVFGAMIMAFSVDKTAALIFVGAIPVLAIIIFGIILLTMPLYKKIQQRLDRLLLLTRESLIGVRVIRAFCRQKEEKQLFHEESNLLLHFQTLAGKISAFLNPLTYIVINLALILLLYVGGHQVNSGTLSQGEVIALVSYLSQILVELIKLVNLIITIAKSIACADRVWNVFEEKSSLFETKEPAMPSDVDACPAIEFSNVSFSYHKGQSAAIKDISFRLSQGKTLGIIGGTGSGKSTLAQLMMRLYDTTSGEIKVFGQPITAFSLEALRKIVGIVPQKATLFKGTIRDNLLFGLENISDEKLLQAVHTAQADNILASRREGLNAMLSQGGTNLSGGQQQRLTIARTIIRQPKILILDDSSSALDMATDTALRQAIATDCSAMTVLFISQRVTSVRRLDHILVLDNGQLAGFGTHEQLLEDCEVYQEICHSQQIGKEAVS